MTARDERPTAARVAASLPQMHQAGVAPSILVVDDQPAITDFLEMGLTREGFSVSTAADGRAALAAAAERQFDLVILDVMLPGLDRDLPPSAR